MIDKNNSARVLSPETYQACRKPLLEAQGLPPNCYRDEAFYQREIETVFSSSWIMVGREEQVVAAGDYITRSIAAIEIFVVRDSEGGVRAFGNSCRHRGARLLNGEGSVRAIACPYHAWTYARDGSLLAAPGMEQVVGFRAEDYSLVGLRTASWGGFIFVCVSQSAPEFADWIGDLAETLAPYRFQDMRAGRRLVFDLECNWKTWVENYMEGYHIPTVHRRTISRHKAVNVPQIRGRGQYDLIWERHPGTLALLGDDAGFAPIDTLSGETAEGSRFALIYPNSMISMTIDAMWSFECHPTGAQTCRVVLTSCFPADRFSLPEFEVLAENYYKRQDIVVEEDNGIAQVQQKGLRSRLAVAGRLSHKEPIVHALANWILDRVVGRP